LAVAFAAAPLRSLAARQAHQISRALGGDHASAPISIAFISHVPFSLAPDVPRRTAPSIAFVLARMFSHFWPISFDTLNFCSIKLHAHVAQASADAVMCV
jgi:hypothetical protein